MEPSAGSRRLLLVDDEILLAQLLEKYLTRLGYIVEACSDPRTAWLRFQAQPDSYAAVLADVEMPGMSGEELLGQMLRLYPRLRMVVMSGCPFDVARLPASGENIVFLQKPFLPKMLAETLKEFLDRPETPPSGAV